MNLTNIHEDQGLIPALCCCVCGMQLGSTIAGAVAYASSCSSNSTLSLGTSICCGCSHKNKQTKRQEKKKQTLNLINSRSHFLVAQWSLGSFSSFFFLLIAAPAAYGSSWTRGWIGAAAEAYATAALDQTHICDLSCSFQQLKILKPLKEARDWTCVGFLTHWTTVGIPRSSSWIRYGIRHAGWWSLSIWSFFFSLRMQI